MGTNILHGHVRIGFFFSNQEFSRENLYAGMKGIYIYGIPEELFSLPQSVFDGIIEAIEKSNIPGSAEPFTVVEYGGVILGSTAPSPGENYELYRENLTPKKDIYTFTLRAFEEIKTVPTGEGVNYGKLSTSYKEIHNGKVAIYLNKSGEASQQVEIVERNIAQILV